MKILNYLLLFLMLFGLTACPEHIDYFELSKLNIKNVHLTYKAVEPNCGTGEYLAINDNAVNNNDTIVWNAWGIEIKFPEILLVSGLKNTSFITSAYAATYAGLPELANKIVEVEISSNSKFDTTAANENLSKYFLAYYNNEKSIQPSLVEAFNKEIAPSAYNGGTICYNSNFLTLKKAPNATFTGKFYLTLRFEDGTVLKDSTRTITIIP